MNIIEMIGEIQKAYSHHHDIANMLSDLRARIENEQPKNNAADHMTIPEPVTIRMMRHKTADGEAICICDGWRCSCAIPDGLDTKEEFVRYYCGLTGEDLTRCERDYRPSPGCPAWKE